MKRVNIKCPYCGSQAFLRPASVVFGEKATDPTAPYYVCAHYPACDSYVSAHRASHMPMGTLADAALRHKRIEAHIGKFSTFRCDQVIELCNQCFRAAGHTA